MLSPALLQGVEEFNRQEFYACHDTLEALWMDSTEPQKSFYQGILQIAVGCYHLENQNWRGAVILLGEGTRRLNHYQPTYEGIDVEHLVNESLHLLKTLQQTEPEHLPQLLETLNASSSGGVHLPMVEDGILRRLPKIVRIDH
ncbi:protein of unknown function DUF309 [Gloeothece citriformis PCC 7424]|uniref:DUF309 domain-containing protein n=1 Tax=Gloeothece citriformis (strain PCC 7424) TaxID=65393 RepID=B7KJ46_GLOC7|nr:DUF309 domain-containing protein [Gloeothece citriformis]ACK72130.1 protein of unknown function DUF309 [Gloeothece citriformis PCC 7424]